MCYLVSSQMQAFMQYYFKAYTILFQRQNVGNKCFSVRAKLCSDGCSLFCPGSHLLPLFLQHFLGYSMYSNNARHFHDLECCPSLLRFRYISNISLSFSFRNSCRVQLHSPIRIYPWEICLSNCWLSINLGTGDEWIQNPRWLWEILKDRTDSGNKSLVAIW